MRLSSADLWRIAEGCGAAVLIAAALMVSSRGVPYDPCVWCAPTWGQWLCDLFYGC